MSNVHFNRAFLTLMFGMSPSIPQYNNTQVDDSIRVSTSKDRYYNKYSNIRNNNTHNRKSHKINQPQWRGYSH